MKAVKIEKPWEVMIVETEKPMPKENEALIKIKSAGICGSDIGAFRGTNSLVSYPRIIGHELAGEVVSIPENSKGIKVGDHVIVDPYLYCGECYPCSIGRTNCCVDLKVLGVHVDGGIAEYFTHPADMLIKVPDDMSWELVPFAEPLTISMHALHRTKLKSGEHFAIYGAGTIGLLAAMGAIHYGAVPILIDIVDERLNFAKTLGIEHVINPAKDDAVQKIKDITNGNMCQVVMEASGSNVAILGALDIVSHAGRIAFTGWPKNPTEIPTDIITKKEIDICGSRTSAGEFEEALDMIYNNKINAKAVVKHVISFDEIPSTIKDIEKNPGDYLKVNILM